MNDGNITRISMAKAKAMTGETDWDRLRREEAAGAEPLMDSDDERFDWLGAVTLQRPRN
jgi:hypothetical protein